MFDESPRSSEPPRLSAAEAISQSKVLTDPAVQATVLAYRGYLERMALGDRQSHSQDTPFRENAEDKIITALAELRVYLDPAEIDAFVRQYPYRQ